MVETALPDGLTLSTGTSALTGVTPPDDITLPAGSELDAAAGDAEAASRDASAADAAAQPGDAMSPRGENSENATNEANFDESVSILQTNESVGVTPNSGVDSGLDKPEETPVKAERNDDTSRGTPPESAFRPPAQIAGVAEHRAPPLGPAARYEEHLRRLRRLGITHARDPDPSAHAIGQLAPEAKSLVRPPP